MLRLLLHLCACAKHTYVGRVFITCANVSAWHHQPCQSHAVPLPSASQGGGSGSHFPGVSSSFTLNEMLFAALQEYSERKQCLGFLFKMQNCLLGVLHLLREQKARTHILEQTPGQCSLNTGQTLLSFTHRYLERLQRNYPGLPQLMCQKSQPNTALGRNPSVLSWLPKKPALSFFLLPCTGENHRSGKVP